MRRRGAYSRRLPPWRPGQPRSVGSTRSVRFMVVLSPGRDSMRRTEVLDGVRMLKFRDVFGRCEQGRLSKLEAAELLGINERTFRRWCRRYEEEGEAGLLDRRLGKPSARRVPAGEVEEVGRLYQDRYAGFTAKH